jgi:uncharacterized protein (UPF0332 family)
MRKAKASELLFIAKANKEKLDALTAGAGLVKRTGYAIDELRVKATLDRFNLARAMLTYAEVALHSKLYRTTVSRAYYSMYHGLRAATFYSFGGDDHEKHADLPSKLPADFPSRATWENALKIARFERNRADYDPYPRIDASFKVVAQTLTVDAQALIPVIKGYLKNKGCSL